jgi:hypothetical protein
MRRVKNLADLIDAIRERPGLYLPARTIECLRAFVDGWLLAGDASGADTNLIGDGFQRWVAERFDVRSPHSWNQIIAFHSKDGFDALDQFFRLFAEYTHSRKR